MKSRVSLDGIAFIQSKDTPKYAGKLCACIAINFIFLPAILRQDPALWLKKKKQYNTHISSEP